MQISLRSTFTPDSRCLAPGVLCLLASDPKFPLHVLPPLCCSVNSQATLTTQYNFFQTYWRNFTSQNLTLSDANLPLTSHISAMATLIVLIVGVNNDHGRAGIIYGRGVHTEFLKMHHFVRRLSAWTDMWILIYQLLVFSLDSGKLNHVLCTYISL